MFLTIKLLIGTSHISYKLFIILSYLFQYKYVCRDCTGIYDVESNSQIHNTSLNALASAEKVIQPHQQEKSTMYLYSKYLLKMMNQSSKEKIIEEEEREEELEEAKQFTKLSKEASILNENTFFNRKNSLSNSNRIAALRIGQTDISYNLETVVDNDADIVNVQHKRSFIKGAIIHRKQSSKSVSNNLKHIQYRLKDLKKKREDEARRNIFKRLYSLFGENEISQDNAIDQTVSNSLTNVEIKITPDKKSTKNARSFHLKKMSTGKNVSKASSKSNSPNKDNLDSQLESESAEPDFDRNGKFKLKKIFIFNDRTMFTITVELTVMLNNLWLALWATNYISLANNSSDPIMWHLLM